MSDESEDPQELIVSNRTFFNPENRVLILDQEINAKTASDFIDQLYTCSEISDNPIVIFFNSPGGEVYSTLMIMNAIQSVDNITIGIVGGCAGSGAFYAFQCCTYRVMFKYSVLFWHEMITLDLSPTASQEEAKKKYSDYVKLNEHILKIFKQKINLDKDTWNKVFEKENDILFNATEALKYNLCDLTIKKTSEIQKVLKNTKQTKGK